MAEDSPEPFEKILAKLEGVVARLEKADLPLEDAITAYEEGLELVKRAQGKLDGMDARLEQLLQSGKTAALERDAAKSSAKSGA
jgi:exodeoxyribonuclease VII small subunit